MSKKVAALCALILTAILLTVGAIGLRESNAPLPSPAITVPDQPPIKFPHFKAVDPKISADSKAKLPREPKPVVKTTPAPKVEVPAPIVETREFPLFPLYPIQEQAPYSIVPEPAPAQRPIYPSLPPVSTVTPPRVPRLSVPLRPPVILDPTPLLPELPAAPENPYTGPVTGILEPITPTLPELPELPKTIEVEIPNELQTEEVLISELQP